MYYLEKLKKQLAADINSILTKEVINPSHFVLPPDPKLGDVSLPCFMLAKEMGENPGIIAKNIAELFPTDKAVSAVTAAGPYVNFTFSSAFAGGVLKEIGTLKARYGMTNLGKKKRVMLEYANQNTHKELHIGHLRNISYGDAVNRLLAANGYTSIPVSYINDFGIHTAKTLWYYLKTKAKAPKDKKGFFLGQLYAAASKELTDHPEAKVEAGAVMKAIESRKGEYYKLWKTTRQWNIDQFSAVYKELGVRFSATFYESDFVKAGFKIVKELEAKGILKKSQGAVIADLESYNLGVLVVIRSDGTGLYPVADLPLTMHKIKKYKLDTALWVIDMRQTQYLNQLFKVLELAGFKAHLAHLPYDFVKLPSGMMSSRSGNIVTYDDLKNEAVKKIIEETKKRHNDWNKKKIEATARVLAFGALKFEMIKVAGDKVITFDMETALRFDGFTSAYLQYTYARIRSMGRKAGKKVKAAKADFSALSEDRERRLVLALARFPEAVAEAGMSYQPSEVARYLYELCQLFNDYYHGVPILNDSSLAPKLAKARLELALSVAAVIKYGLNLLGIETVEEM